MGLLQPAGEPPKLFKAGFYGGAGSGKTHTATLCAIGVALEGKKLVAFMDTEASGSDFVKPLYDSAGVKLLVMKGRSFSELITVMKEAHELKVDCLVIDSLTHVWQEIVEAYMNKRNLTRMEFHHWKDVKTQWRTFVTGFLNAPYSIILCGRAGYEYETTINEKGKREIQKGDMKMKAEGETGYEPNVVVELYRGSDDDHRFRRGVVVKDRARTIDGAEFIDPSWADFLPHWNALSASAVPGEISDATSEDLIPLERESIPQSRRDAWVAEIKAVYDDMLPGSTQDIKSLKSCINHVVFDRRSFDRMAELDPYTLQNGAVRLARVIKDVREFQEKFSDASIDEVKQYIETLKEESASQLAESELNL